MSKLQKLITYSAIIHCLSGCQLNTQPQVDPIIAKISSHEQQQAEQMARALIAKYSLEELDRSPMLQAYRGLKTNYNKWDDISEQAAAQQQIQAQTFLKDAEKINPIALNTDLRISLELLIYQLKQSINTYEFRHLNYPVNQLFGLHTEIPDFLINIHQISNIQDANAYIERVEGIRPLFKQLIEQLEIRKKNGIIAPEFAYEAAIKQCHQLTQGMPFDKAEDSILLADFKEKIDNLALYESSKAVLIKRLNRALKRNLFPAYKELERNLISLKEIASKETGVHQFDNGTAFYEMRLKEITTTNLSAKEMHNLGLKSVTRIRQEITLLLPQLGQESLESLFKNTRTDRSLYLQNTESVMAKSRSFITQMNEKLNVAFANIPNIPMELLATDYEQADQLGSAFYESGSNDGSIPARLYINSKKLDELPSFQLETLIYHEAIPGKHLQNIYAQQHKHLTSLRRHAYFSAYTDGWALYSETIAKELNGFQNPWNEYGRLLLDLWRSNQLVIDTGLHAMGWSLDEAVQYQMDNTPFNDNANTEIIKQYLVTPGQATAEKIGELQFLALREKAQVNLGNQFSLPNFHEYILTLGPLPFVVLEKQVDSWIEQQKSSS